MIGRAQIARTTALPQRSGRPRPPEPPGAGRSDSLGEAPLDTALTEGPDLMPMPKKRRNRRPDIRLWSITEEGLDTPVDPVFWEATEDGGVDCGLCYRNCRLEDGQTGPCGYRTNDGGVLALKGHGVVSCVVRQIRGFGPDPFLTYKPGATSVFLGGTRCTARCTFCMSADIVWRPERLEWVPTPNHVMGGDSSWYGVAAYMHPIDAVGAARKKGAKQILFGINEPTLSFEWTYDVARLAKAEGIDVCVETNGFTAPEAIRRLAPYVDAVDVGVKGSADPEFYRRWMKSEGAVPSVLESLKTWRDAGVHLIVGDLIAPPHMQDEATFEEAATRFYAYLAEHVGPLTPVLTTHIAEPGPTLPDGSNGRMLVKPRGDAAAEAAYVDRLAWALQLGKAAGLPYATARKRLARCSPATRAGSRCWSSRSGVARACRSPGCPTRCNASCPLRSVRGGP
ncbi:radical SAM protein [Streptomyces sp. NPDC101115]|uniref:radical SAM protein n=1 Tax=Streptomyces sp. NPDC101115 TaxID=3366106 RepID=UPI00380C1C49